jgi:hypothetical protein
LTAQNAASEKKKIFHDLSNTNSIPILFLDCFGGYDLFGLFLHFFPEMVLVALQ